MRVEAFLLVVEFLNILPQRYDRVLVGQRAHDLSNRINITLLLADQLRILAVILEQLVVIGSQALIRVFQKHSVHVSQVQQVRRCALEIAVRIRVHTFPVVFYCVFFGDFFLVVKEFYRVQSNGPSIIMHASGTDIRVHAEENGHWVL